MSGLNRNLAVTALQRLFTIVAVLWGAATLTFIAVKLIPGDPVEVMMGERRVDPQMHAEALHRLGLDKPLGSIDRSKLNVNGSSLAAGHPFAATGGRIVAALSTPTTNPVVPTSPTSVRVVFPGPQATSRTRRSPGRDR